MDKEQKVISPSQFSLIIISFLVGSASLFVPEIGAGRDAWISTIIASLIGLYPFFIIIYLQSKFKGLTIVQYSELLLGKFFGKLMGFALVLNMFLVSSLITENLTLLFKIAIMPETPEIIFRISLVGLCTYAIFSGIESIGRLAELYTIPIVLMLLILPIITIGEMNFNFLQPVLADGFKPVLVGSISAFNFPFGEIFLLGMVLPTVQEGKKTTPLYFFSYILAAFLLLLRTVVALTVFSESAVAIIKLPLYQILRLIDLGEFLNRIEVIFIFILTLSFFLKLLITFYGMVLGAGQVFNLKEKNSLIIPLGFITIFLSNIMFASPGYLRLFSERANPLISLVMYLFYPTLLLVLSFFQKKEAE